MHDADLERRALLKLLGGCAAAGLAGCAARETPHDGLIRLFGLDGDERAWLAALAAPEQRELYDLLTGPDPANARAVRLTAKLLGGRSRLFAFVGYPPVQDRRSVCDGLIRE